ncbi:hypothetical protein B4U80_09407 [Leptotrombidium deliense]|uniref:Uncharacterized protein n=1 Tax=Leptotrombidium deliense TaxID=299467 RepID=A0A443S0N2_9ACAR|nr:hypothetical protein B4U80_09407 [Leptotrombidium deliense]
MLIGKASNTNITIPSSANENIHMSFRPPIHIKSEVNPLSAKKDRNCKASDAGLTKRDQISPGSIQLHHCEQGREGEE